MYVAVSQEKNYAKRVSVYVTVKQSLDPNNLLVAVDLKMTRNTHNHSRGEKRHGVVQI